MVVGRDGVSGGEWVDGVAVGQGGGGAGVGWGEERKETAGDRETGRGKGGREVREEREEREEREMEGERKGAEDLQCSKTIPARICLSAFLAFALNKARSLRSL